MKHPAFSLIQALVAMLLFTIGMQPVLALIMTHLQSVNDFRQSRIAWRLLINCATQTSGVQTQPSQRSFDRRGQLDQGTPFYEVTLDVAEPTTAAQVSWRRRQSEQVIMLDKVLDGLR